ncbi:MULTISPECIES: primosomal replication protein N [Idiomarina]|jgi:primosomal replication protein N|uniref:Replication restart protein PriB n=2 Tax=Idiomarina baltica TaxID=190892 RepID=A0A348WMH7_9GAMM|nr:MULTISPECIES: primosomal replication protein N [Idiomarina]MAD53436.1 primosomal replication protein N [Idiomarinaceae bacterium]MEC7642730.1 primosomal replication protein N [Pseudomonadota bacterium]EAQ30870.1 primosomal replication protein N [Idiomarina baltica OS145]MAF76109.1 primosomal replication protein N [Idiomarinaceae bacterium]MBL73669.1 primosomal replication protein N [Idiomarinaceae bacterium]|tara:strand:+ start:1212 stop:1511 length:300 start_codon:yes stop_codon:yes gene_type:complete
MNRLHLTGHVCKPARLEKSPSGIEHIQFSLEHRSMQAEAGMSRQSFVRLQVIMSGEGLTHWLDKLTVGSEVHTEGFLHRHEDKQGLAKLVLHAQHLEMI